MKKEIKFFSYCLITLGTVVVLLNCCKKHEPSEILIIESTLTDNEGNIYKAVTIGSQVWMAENLKVTKYLNGDLIGTTQPIDLNIETEVSPKYQWPYKDGNEIDIVANVATYGRLYTWYAVTDARKICPDGWHVPSSEEWTQLFDYIGGEEIAGGILKETGYTHWRSPNIGATNDYGFTALGGGARFSDGGTGNLKMFGSWWSSSEHDPPTRAKEVVITYDFQSTGIGLAFQSTGMSVRCVKN